MTADDSDSVYGYGYSDILEWGVHGTGITVKYNIWR